MRSPYASSLLMLLGACAVLATPNDDRTDEPSPRNTTTHHLQKRSWTPITCDNTIDGVPYSTFHSVCDRPDPRAWDCVAAQNTNPGTFHTTSGTCAPFEICIDGITGLHPGIDPESPLAYCVDKEGMVSLSSRMINAMNRGKPLPWTYIAGNSADDQNGKSVAEFVFEGEDKKGKDTLLDSITLVAQSAQAVLSTGQMYTEVGRKTCEKCSSLGFEPVPEGTSRFAVLGKFPKGVSSGLLYLASV